MRRLNFFSTSLVSRGKRTEVPINISVLHNIRQLAQYSYFKQFALLSLNSWSFLCMLERPAERLLLILFCFFRRLPLYLVNHHLQALADTLKGEELPDVMDQFDAIDVDKNDSIGFEEMRQVDFLISDRYNNTMPLPHIYNLLS